MNTPKAHFGPKGGGCYVERAKARHGGKPSDWVMALAHRLDAETAAGGSQNSLGRQIDLSGATISAIIGNTYPGGTAKLEAIVRGKLMSARVKCPALGTDIGRDRCADNQTRKFSAANPQLVKLHRICPGCPNFLGGRS